MLNKTSSIKRILLLVSVFAVFVVLGLSDLADARSSSGGRSMGSSRSGSASSPSKSFGNPSSPSGSGSFSPLSGGGGSSFLRGVGGGIVGGMIGNMIFGGSGHAGGMGGGGSIGIGIFELLILGGLGFFIYKRFIKPQISRNPSVGSVRVRRKAAYGLIGLWSVLTNPRILRVRFLHLLIHFLQEIFRQQASRRRSLRRRWFRLHPKPVST